MSVAATAVVFPGTQLGPGVAVEDHAVAGKQATLGRTSTARREALAPLVVGEGCSILAGAVVFAGTELRNRVIVGDHACVRERVVIGEGTVIGAGALVENDVAIGARCRIQAGAYVTAYTTIEDDVFVAPRVVTTNDNYMGRTERRHAERRGPTIRRGARIGAGAVILPGVEIGAEAFVGAGAVVLRDVPARAVVVGNPARQIREVPVEELLEEA
jgi:acetyltransferase-like isoleucine patch superfamily enzyme